MTEGKSQTLEFQSECTLKSETLNIVSTQIYCELSYYPPRLLIPCPFTIEDINCQNSIN